MFTIKHAEFLAPGVKRFVIEAPRLFAQHPALAAGIRPQVALYVDQEYRRVMRAELAARSVPVVGLPREVYDDRGFMRGHS